MQAKKPNVETINLSPEMMKLIEESGPARYHAWKWEELKAIWYVWDKVIRVNFCRNLRRGYDTVANAYKKMQIYYEKKGAALEDEDFKKLVGEL